MGYYRLLLGDLHGVRFDAQPRNFVHRHTFFEPCLVVAGRQVGIEHPAQFSRLFKKVIGVSPRQFRASKIPAASRRTVFVKVGGVAMKTEFQDK